MARTRQWSKGGLVGGGQTRGRRGHHLIVRYLCASEMMGRCKSIKEDQCLVGPAAHCHRTHDSWPLSKPLFHHEISTSHRGWLDSATPVRLQIQRGGSGFSASTAA